MNREVQAAFLSFSMGGNHTGVRIYQVFKDEVFSPIHIITKKSNFQLKKQKSVSARQLKCSFSRLILNITGLYVLCPYF